MLPNYIMQTKRVKNEILNIIFSWLLCLNVVSFQSCNLYLCRKTFIRRMRILVCSEAVLQFKTFVCIPVLNIFVEISFLRINYCIYPLRLNVQIIHFFWSEISIHVIIFSLPRFSLLLPIIYSITNFARPSVHLHIVCAFLLQVLFIIIVIFSKKIPHLFVFCIKTNILPVILGLESVSLFFF